MGNFERLPGPPKERNQMKYYKAIANKPFTDFGKNSQRESSRGCNLFLNWPFFLFHYEDFQAQGCNF
jgi:hypothetical protein